MKGFSDRNDVPVFIGEFSVTEKREPEQRTRWLTAVATAAVARKMIPVLWDTGHDLSRYSPYGASDELKAMLKSLAAPASK